MTYNSVVCLTGESMELQTDLSELLDDGYEVLDIHSQFVETGRGYDKPKSIIWLRKVTNGQND